MNFKPYRDYSEHDVVNGLFALSAATGSKATPIVIVGSGTNTNAALSIGANLAPSTLPNVYSPRFSVAARVRPAVSGEKPFGITLYDTLEVNQWSYPLVYDKMRREELQATVSGQAVPIARKGLFTVGPLFTGDVPSAGKYCMVRTTGDFGVSSTKTGVSGVPLPVFGEYLGPKDADGYAIVSLNCYL